jgi:hypothetical protein
MTTIPNANDATSVDQRDSLEQSEKKAAEKQPGSYNEKATEEKLVEIGPDLTDNPIKGIDPAEEATRRA